MISYLSSFIWEQEIDEPKISDLGTTIQKELVYDVPVREDKKLKKDESIMNSKEFIDQINYIGKVGYRTYFIKRNKD